MLNVPPFSAGRPYMRPHPAIAHLNSTQNGDLSNRGAQRLEVNCGLQAHRCSERSPAS